MKTKTLISLLLAVFFLFTVIPFIWLIAASFKTSPELFENTFGLPQSWSFFNYRAVFADQPMIHYLLNSFIAAAGSTLLAIAICSMASYSFLYRFRLSPAILAFVTFGLFLPTNAFMAPYYFIINWLGLYDSVWGLVVIYCATSVPLCLLIIKAYMDTIPGEIIEAAKVDGATFHGTFFRIVLPLSSPGIVTAAIFLMITAWNELLFANLLTQSESSRTVQVGIRFFLTTFHANYPEAFAGMVVAILPTILIYTFLSDRIVSGLTAGAVKGV